MSKTKKIKFKDLDTPIKIGVIGGIIILIVYILQFLAFGLGFLMG